MYTNISIRELTDIIKNILGNNTTRKTKANDVNRHTYKPKVLIANNQYFKQNDGLASGVPTSAFLAEIFIQHFEHASIINILKKHNTIDYFRYVDDLLIIYNKDTTNFENTLADLNSIRPNIQFNIEKEPQNKLNSSVVYRSEVLGSVPGATKCSEK
jgi:hypothetical protein